MASIVGQMAGSSRDGKLAEMNMAEFMALLRPYFWPTNGWDRARALSCFLCLGISKVRSCECALEFRVSADAPAVVQASGILAPIFLGQAVDKISRGELPVDLFAIWAALVSAE